MIEISFNSSENYHQLRASLPNSVVEQAGREAETWRRSIVNERLAKLAKASEYATVETLERRKAEAEATLETMNRRIGEIKAACASQVLAEDGSVDAAADEIERCEKAIRAAQLTLDSVDLNLPAAVEARRAFTKTAIREVLAGLGDKLREEKHKAEAGVDDSVHAAVVKVMAAARRFELLNHALSQNVDYVLRCASEQTK